MACRRPGFRAWQLAAARWPPVADRGPTRPIPLGKASALPGARLLAGPDAERSCFCPRTRRWRPVSRGAKRRPLGTANRRMAARPVRGRREFSRPAAAPPALRTDKPQMPRSRAPPTQAPISEADASSATEISSGSAAACRPDHASAQPTARRARMRSSGAAGHGECPSGEVPDPVCLAGRNGDGGGTHQPLALPSPGRG